MKALAPIVTAVTKPELCMTDEVSIVGTTATAVGMEAPSRFDVKAYSSFTRMLTNRVRWTGDFDFCE